MEHLAEQGQVDMWQVDVFYGDDHGTVRQRGVGAFSWAIERPTGVVLDNARLHTKALEEREAVWQALAAVGASLFIRFSAFRVT